MTKWPLLLTLSLPDLEALLNKCLRDADPDQPSDREFVHDLCEEIFARRQNPSLRVKP